MYRTKYVKESTVAEAKAFLKSLVRIDSVEAPAVGQKPFGEGVAEALDLALATMKDAGFSVKNGDYFYGYGEVGEGDLFGVLCHLDVVPVDKNWSVDPFGAVEKDGKLFGRGTLDDKGPYAACLYAAIELLREGLTPKCKLRFIVGCDEESGWRCMDHYVEQEELHKRGISPDGDFPVINCEKGIVYHVIRMPKPAFIKDFVSGSRANMVPDYARVEYADGRVVETKGKSAHGSHPEAGDNALVRVLTAIAEDDERFAALAHAFSASDGKNVGLALSDDVSGPLTLNLGCARTEGDEIVFELDIRHPVTINKDDVTAILQKNLQCLTVEQGFFHLPLYVDKENDLVKSLLSAYDQVMGGKAEPIAIGGGTYARVLPLGVAFGPCFPGGNEGMHCPDEYMDLDDFAKMMDIYYLALKKLCF
ncbi:MAG: Sapep family Mn(2+)-dependent dipeptidase [Clostridia bacterium]|nr:Sapep family Mn(2+)-dependent dipeptidase [Clostridia bacterium]